MSVNSKTKGKVGELEVAKLLREFGYQARRGQQFSGGGDSPDVVHDVPGLHLEVKRTERLKLWDAMEQASRDAAAGNVPVVVHRSNHKPWVVVLDARHFFDIIGRTADGRSETANDGGPAGGAAAADRVGAGGGGEGIRRRGVRRGPPSDVCPRLLSGEAGGAVQ